MHVQGVRRPPVAPATWPGIADGAPIRVPLRGNVPAGPAVRALVDTGPMQRLRGVRQLGLAHLVYPGGGHSRFEHSLGVYALGRLLLGHLFARSGRQHLEEQDGFDFLAACLLHDVGHYPFSHTLEEIPPHPEGRFQITRHDERARSLILGDRDVLRVLRERWGADPERIARIIDERDTGGDAADARLRHLLCGPLNPDRLDYLERDSRHAGVPYGRALDIPRLLDSIDFVPNGTALGVSPKGVPAVETLIFASYLMYRETYWHHTVRAAQAMLKRAVCEALLRGELDLERLVAADDEQAMALLRGCPNPATAELTRGLGPGRRLYRRVWSGSLEQADGLAPGAARDLLVDIGTGDPWAAEARLAGVVAAYNARHGNTVAPHQLVCDVAGRGKELFFEVPLVGSPLGAASTRDPRVSLIAPSLADNFERHAKRVQLLAAVDVAPTLARYLGLQGPGGEA